MRPKASSQMAIVNRRYKNGSDGYCSLPLPTIPCSQHYTRHTIGLPKRASPRIFTYYRYGLKLFEIICFDLKCFLGGKKTKIEIEDRFANFDL